MIILGAGMAGLLAGGVLRNKADAIYEAQTSLPNNHRALLRFRSRVVGDTLGIAFKEVRAVKSIESTGNGLKDALLYSKKVTNDYSIRSIISASGEMSTRYIAPPDLIDQMAKRVMCPIHYGHILTGIEGLRQIRKRGIGVEELPIISTLPMAVLHRILECPLELPTFRSYPMITIRTKIKGANAYGTVYTPSHDTPFARVSITGNEVIGEIVIACEENQQIYERALIENASHQEGTALSILASMLEILGIPVSEVDSDVEVSSSKYGKIAPIDEDWRREFISWATDEHNVYSLGRFATWRPGLLLDDVVKDISQIQLLASSPHSRRLLRHSHFSKKG